MTIEQLFIALLSMITGGLGWFARQVWDKAQENEKELHNFKVDVGSNYIRYDRLDHAMKPIMEALQEIKETLKTKADK